MALFAIKSFLGLHTGESEPPPGSASSINNFKRHRVRGQLELADGVQSNLTFNPTVYGVPAFTPIGFKSFYVADQGGRTVTVVYATYTKTAQGFSGWGTNSFSGYWVRPFYDGTQWVDDWRELTEFQVFRYTSKTSNTVTVESSLSLPSWGADYLKGWTLIKSGDQSLTTDTGLLITASSGAVLTVAATGADTNITSWSSGSTLLFAFRGLHGQSFPSSASQLTLRRLMDELRVSTGNLTADVDSATFYRDKTFFRNNNFVRKGTFAERGNFVVPVPAFGHGGVLPDGSNPSDGLPAGTYEMKTSIATDDGQESDLRSRIETATTGALTLSATQSGGGGINPGVRVGNYQYVMGGTASSGFGFTSISKVDLTTMSVVHTIYSNQYGFSGIATDGTYLYTVQTNEFSFNHNLLKLDLDLGFVTFGQTFTHVSNYWPSGSYGAISGGYYLTILQHTGASAPRVIRWSTGGTYTDNLTLTGTEAVTGMAGDGSAATKVFISRNDPSTYHVSIIDTTTGTMSENVASLSSVSTAPGSATYYGGYAYISCGTKIQRIDTSGTNSNWISGGKVASGTLANNGVYIYLATSSYVVAYSIGGASEAESKSVTGLTPIIGPMVGYEVIGLVGPSLTKYLHTPSNATLTSSGQLRYGARFFISPGLIPIRAKWLRVWLSQNGGPYYLVKSYSILQDSETNYLNFDSGTVWLADKSHYYYRSSYLTFGGSDWAGAQVSATTQLGRLDSDTGAAKYLWAVTSNNRTYLAGRSVAGRLQRNKVYLSAVSGDGVSQYDVYPNDVQYVLDAEFNDGDYIVALGPMAERILVLKTRSLVLLTPNTDGTHNRDIVATGVGLAAVNSLVSFNESLYWLDHSGAWSFNAQGLKKISGPIDSTLFTYTNAQRSAATAVVDPKNLMLRLSVGGTIYSYDMTDGEWVTETTRNPIWYDDDLGFGTGAGSAQNAPSGRRYCELVNISGTYYVQTPIEDTLSGGLTGVYNSHKIELPLERGYDGLLNAIYIDYDMQGTTPTATLGIYLDDAGSPVKTFTLPSGKNEATIAAPLSSRCKAFSLRLTVTPTSGQKFKLRRMGAYYSQILVGGDRQIV